MKENKNVLFGICLQYIKNRVAIFVPRDY